MGCLAQSVHLESAGARFGFLGRGAGTGFHEAEGFVNWDLPWAWDFGSAWFLQTRLDASMGWLGDSGADSFIGTFGPSLVAGHQDFPLSLEVGVSPTLLSLDDFPSKNLGAAFEFTSHVGLNFDITSHIRLGYRFQHLSNAGIGRHNPGLNLHMLGLSYLF